MDLQELKKVAVLQALDETALTRLAAVLEERGFGEGEVIFAEDAPGDGMYFIVSGTVRIEKRTGAAPTDHKTIAVLEAGDYFGEVALFDQQPRSASAVAAAGARTLRLSKAAFDSLRSTGGRAGESVLFAMIQTSGQRIRRLTAHMVVYDEVGRAIGECQKLEPLLEVVVRQLGQATLADWGMVVVRARFSDRLELRGAASLNLSSGQKDAIAEGKGFLAPALREPRARLVRNFDEEEPFKSCPRLGFETASLLLAPILIEGQVLGLIALGDRQPGQFDLNDLNLAVGIARQTASAILNARHREDEESRARHTKQFVRF